MRYLVLVIFLFGCTTLKKTEKKIEKIEKKYPQLLPKICSVKFPCIPRKSDTITKVEYDFIELECHDGKVPITSKDSTDTLYVIKYKERKITKTIKVPCESKTIIQYVLDSAQVKDLTNKLDNANKLCSKETKKAKTFKILSEILGLLLVLILIGLYLVRKWVFRAK
jgi:hypothetical protein